MTTIFLGHTCAWWASREEAIAFFEKFFEHDDMPPEVRDRVYRILDNLRTGKDPAVDFE